MTVATLLTDILDVRVSPHRFAEHTFQAREYRYFLDKQSLNHITANIREKANQETRINLTLRE